MTDTASTDPQPGPLSGVTVLELGVFIAGPYATMQLADMGAGVIKIEPPAGDPMRAAGPFLDGESSPFIRLNRNKESVFLDLKSDAGRAGLHALLAEADVLVENMRPGALTKMGFGYEELIERTVTGAPLTQWAIKENLLRLQSGGTVDDSDVIETVYGSRDFAAAVEGFLSKTPVQWTGK